MSSLLKNDLPSSPPSTMLSSRAGYVCGICLFGFLLVLKYAWETRFDANAEPLCQIAPPFADWTETVHLLVVGASLGTLGIQIFKVLHLLLHPERRVVSGVMVSVVFIMVMSSSSQTMALTKLFPLCQDSFGFRSPAVIWVEWQVSVPLLFFLCIALDTDKTALDAADGTIIAAAALSIAGSLVTNFNIGMLPSLAALAVSCLSMVASLSLNLVISLNRYRHASAMPCVTARELFVCKVAYRKLSCSVFVAAFFPLFPLAYFLVVSKLISPDAGFACIIILNFFAKSIFSEIVLNEHLDATDPSAFQLLVEKRANESRRAFLRYVFHEVRVPLNSITMGLHLLSDNDDLDEQSRETVSMMKEATSYMSETLNDVLSIQKIEDGKLELQYDNFLIRSVLYTVSNSLKGQLDGKGITLLTSIKHNVPKEVVGDRFRIEHVLANFLSNAIKFSPEYSTIKVLVSYGDKVKGCVTFTVADQGEGIAPEHISSLFTDYMQINPEAMQDGKGTGVGLSISKNIVSLHGGKVGCSSRLRVGDDITTGGSKFFFSIPFTIVEPEDDGDELPISGGSTGLAETPAAERQCLDLRVLIVDDVSSNRKMLSMVLSKKGLSCTMAGDGLEAISSVSSSSLSPPHLIFMDSRMPRMSGLAATRRIRLNGFRNLIIGFTGNALEEDVDEFLAAGVDLVLPKPLKMAHLDSLLAYCAQHGSHSELTFRDDGGAAKNSNLASVIGIDKSG